MKNSFYPLIIFRMTYALVHVSIDNFEIRYTVTSENSCNSERSRFQYMSGTSIKKCVKECGARSHCQALNYRTKINVCELFLTSSEEGELSEGNCLFIVKNDIIVTKKPCQLDCNYGEVCENNGRGTGKCSIEECVNVTVLDHGAILGNERSVGKKIRFKCDQNYEEKNALQTTVAECLNMGMWSATAKCVKSPTIGMACRRNNNCTETEGTCIEGKCFCNRLYRYDVNIKDCVKEFEVYPGLAIRGYNDIAFKSTYDSVEGCINDCIDEEDCLVIDVVKNIPGEVECHRGSVTREMILDADPNKLFNFTATLYSRKCN